MRLQDYRTLHREFVRQFRPANAAAVAAAKFRRRIDQADVAAVAAIGFTVSGFDGGGGGGNQHDGGPTGMGLGVFGRNLSFYDAFANGVVDPWWSQWRGAWTEDADVMSTGLTGGTGTPRKLAAYNAVTMAQATVSAEIDSSPARAMVFACGAFDGSNLSGYVALAGTANTQLIRFDSGTPTVLETIAQVSAIGDEIGIIVPANRANPIRASFNGSAIGTGSVDATYTDGYVGLGCYSAGGVGYRSFSATSTDA